ncbi:hypothetical protein M0804_013951 [Polistes exclamans]|nr:hypothetical protein M0804_013951 [Polistes exclamans]
MEKLLEDNNTYSLLNKDPTNKFEKMANNLITKLQNESIITEAMGKNLRSYNTVSPKLYGLRKTHKKECNMRPVSMSLSNAFYRYEWYTISPNNLKMINICMLRMKKPQQLTSGKFFILSLTTFTDVSISFILKTSMGYLSVLRNVL